MPGSLPEGPGGRTSPVAGTASRFRDGAAAYRHGGLAVIIAGDPGDNLAGPGGRHATSTRLNKNTLKGFPASLLMLLPGPAIAAGAGALPSLVFDISACFIAAGVFTVVFARLNIPEIAAFLVAGAVIGPFAFGIVSDPENIDTISQLGLILLLFLVGLEIDLKKLFGSGPALAVTGLAQYPLCVAASVLFIKMLAWLGIGGAVLGGGYAPLYAGFVAAASSTLLVVKLHQQHLQLDTQVGRVSLGLLIFQDFWAIVVIALQPNFAEPDAGVIAAALAGVAALSCIAYLLARYLVPVAFDWIARIPEVMLVAALAWCCAVVLIGLNLDVAAGVLLPPEYPVAVGASMGALIAGASIANLPHSDEITGKVGAVKDFFIILFFVGLGMSIPRPDGFGVVAVAILFALVVIALRYIVFFPLLYFTGLDRRSALVASTRLAQVSEFSLVVGFLGMQLGHISAEFNSAIIFAFVLTALITPALYRHAHALHDRAAPLLERIGFRAPAASEADDADAPKVLLLGFHRVASSLLHELDRAFPGILDEVLVLDFNVALHRGITDLGARVRYADISNESSLHHAGIDRAAVVVCTIPDDLLKGTSNRKLVRTVRRLNPRAVIIANALEFAEMRAIYEAGADYVYLSRVEVAAGLAGVIAPLLNGDQAPLARARGRQADWSERMEVMR